MSGSVTSLWLWSVGKEKGPEGFPALGLLRR